MIDLAPHRAWIGMIAVAVILALSNGPILGLAQQKAEQKRRQLQEGNRTAQAALAQLQEDIAATERMKSEIDDATAKRYLAPVDRLRAAKILEEQANEAGLRSLTYALAPEEPAVFDALGAGKQELATARWTVSADAATDLDIYAFLDSMTRSLPGRITINALTIERMDKEARPLSAVNVHVQANGEWLSNGAAKNLSESP